MIVFGDRLTVALVIVARSHLLESQDQLIHSDLSALAYNIAYTGNYTSHENPDNPNWRCRNRCRDGGE